MKLTKQQIQNIVFDVAAIYINHGETDQRILAPTRGGASFVVEQEMKQIERDGSRGKEKGLERVVAENAVITARLMDMSQENIKLALPGAIIDPATKKITSGITGLIADTDYVKNIAIVGKTMGGKHKICKLYNGLNDNGLSIDTQDRDETVLELQIGGRWDPEDDTKPLYDIEDVTL